MHCRQSTKPPEHVGEEDCDTASIPEEELDLDDAGADEYDYDSDDERQNGNGSMTPLSTPAPGGADKQHQHQHRGLIGSVVWITVQPSVIAFSVVTGSTKVLLDKLPLLSLLQVRSWISPVCCYRFGLQWRKTCYAPVQST